MDFIDKKDKLADLVENYAREKTPENLNLLFDLIDELKFDDDFKSRELFTKLFDELKRFSEELSSRELKQRSLIIRSYLD